MPDVMDQLGLTDESLIEKHLKPLLNAKETKFFPYRKTIFVKPPKVKPEDPDPAPVETVVQVIDMKEVAALGTRLVALDMAFKLKGSYAPKQIDLDPAKTGFKVINVGNFPPRYPLLG